MIWKERNNRTKLFFKQQLLRTGKKVLFSKVGAKFFLQFASKSFGLVRFENSIENVSGECLIELCGLELT